MFVDTFDIFKKNISSLLPLPFLFYIYIYVLCFNLCFPISFHLFNSIPFVFVLSLYLFYFFQGYIRTIDSSLSPSPFIIRFLRTYGHFVLVICPSMRKVWYIYPYNIFRVIMWNYIKFYVWHHTWISIHTAIHVLYDPEIIASKRTFPGHTVSTKL